jgi:hypothetical protein
MAGLHGLMGKTPMAMPLKASGFSAKGVLRGVTARAQLDKSVVTSVLGKKGLSYAGAIKQMQDAKSRIDWADRAVEVLNARSAKLDPESPKYEDLLAEHEDMLRIRKEAVQDFLAGCMLVMLYEMGLIQ